MDALDAGVVQGRAVSSLSSIVSFGTIVDFDVAMGRKLTLCGTGMVMSEKEFAKVILHGKATS